MEGSTEAVTEHRVGEEHGANGSADDGLPEFVQEPVQEPVEESGEAEAIQPEGGEEQGKGEHNHQSRHRGRRGGRGRRAKNGQDGAFTHDEAPSAAVPLDGQPVEQMSERRMPFEQAPYEADTPSSLTIESALPLPPAPPAVAAQAPQPAEPAPPPPPPAVPVITAPPENPKRGWWRR
jgi:ribonuclease E